MEDQMEPNSDQFQDQQSNSDTFSSVKIKNEVQKESTDNNIFETSIELPISLASTADQSSNQLVEDKIDDQIISMIYDWSENEQPLSNVNTTIKTEKGSTSDSCRFQGFKPYENKMNDQLESNSEQIRNQGFNPNAWSFMEINSPKSVRPQTVTNDQNVQGNYNNHVSPSPGIRTTTYTPSITRLQQHNNQVQNFQSNYNNNTSHSSGNSSSIYTPALSRPLGQLFQLNDPRYSRPKASHTFNNTTPSNYFAQSFGDNQMQQNYRMAQDTNTNNITGVKHDFQRRIRRNFNEDHASHMRNTFNRIHRHTAVDFDLMTKVFNNLKAPYELPFTKEQVIECYDWYLGALQYNYVPGRRKQTPREKDRIAMDDEMGMIAAARKSTDIQNEVICLD